VGLPAELLGAVVQEDVLPSGLVLAAFYLIRLLVRGEVGVSSSVCAGRSTRGTARGQELLRQMCCRSS